MTATGDCRGLDDTGDDARGTSTGCGVGCAVPPLLRWAVGVGAVGGVRRGGCGVRGCGVRAFAAGFTGIAAGCFVK